MASWSRNDRVVIGSSRLDFGKIKPSGRITLQEAKKAGYIIRPGFEKGIFLVSNPKVEVLDLSRNGNQPAKFNVHSDGVSRWLDDVPTVSGRVRIDLPPAPGRH